jgi:hypothetical protein
MAFRYTPTPTPSVSPTISLTPSITPTITPSSTSCPFICCLSTDGVVASFLTRIAIKKDGELIILGANITSYAGNPINSKENIVIDNCGGYITSMSKSFGGSNCGNYFGAIGLFNDEKILVASSPSVQKYNTDYSVDTSWNIGYMKPNAQPICAGAYDLDISTLDGSSLIGIETLTGYTNSTGTYTGLTGLLKLNSNGEIQTGFANRCSPNPRMTPIYEANGNKWYIGGIRSYDGLTGNTGVVRVKSNGDIDPTFNFYNPSNYYPNGSGAITTMVKQTDGKLICAADIVPYLFRLNIDGSLDTSFTASSPYLTNGINAIKLQPDGKIICADSGNGRVYRLNSNGSTDATFNVGLTSGAEFDINIDGGGNIWIVGQFLTYNGISAKRMVKLDSDGIDNRCPEPSNTPTITPTQTNTPSPTSTQVNTPTPSYTSTPTPTKSITYDLYEADRFTCLYPGCALDASGVVVALPAGTIPNYGKFYSSLVPDGFSYELIGLSTGGPGWILSTLNYTSCADACAV